MDLTKTPPQLSIEAIQQQADAGYDAFHEWWNGLKDPKSSYFKQYGQQSALYAWLWVMKEFTQVGSKINRRQYERSRKGYEKTLDEAELDAKVDFIEGRRETEELTTEEIEAFTKPPERDEEAEVGRYWYYIDKPSLTIIEVIVPMSKWKDRQYQEKILEMQIKNLPRGIAYDKEKGKYRLKMQKNGQQFRRDYTSLLSCYKDYVSKVKEIHQYVPTAFTKELPKDAQVYAPK